ncbi:MAG: RadC family protein [bacterium]
MSSDKPFSRSAFEFLVENGIYPIWKGGGVLFRTSKKGVLTAEKVKELIEQLDIKSKKDCDDLREKVKREVSLRREHIPIKEWVPEERPREMLMKYGADKLPLSKLLAIILRTGKEGLSAEELGKKLLNHFKTLSQLDSVPISELCKIEGIGMAKAVQIKAAFELGKRLYREMAEEKKRITSPDDALEYVSEYYGPYLKDAKQEFFQLILLDIKNKPIEKIELSKGSIDSTVVDPKMIVKEATLRSASSVILVHNHPSGDTTPSSDDISLTRRVVQACELVGVKVLDHIIIGKTKERYFSFAKEGLLK